MNHLDPILYGRDGTEGIVSVQLFTDDPNGGQCHVRVYKREGDNLTHETVRFYPFFFVSNMKHLRGIDKGWYKFARLEGDGFYKYIIVLSSWITMWRALKQIRENLRTREKYPKEIYIIKSPEQQYLMQSGRTLFKGMVYRDLKRLHFDIEAISHTGFPNAHRPEHYISIISVKADDFEACYYIGDQGMYPNGKMPSGAEALAFPDEKSMLGAFSGKVKEIDPDVIVGHNLYSFDLPYVKTRMEMHGLKMNWGRDGTEPQTYETKIRFAERDIGYTAFQFAGRHVIDTMFLVMAFDVVKRNMPGYSLKDAAKYFGFAPEGRTYVPGDQIAATWESDPRKLLDYALDDVIETERLAEHLGGAIFYSTQMIPMNYDRVARAGTAAKIEALMVREYVNRRHSLPALDDGYPEVAQLIDDERNMEVGGYADVFKIGVYDNIVYADVASLYPSIMIQYEVEPSGDDLKVFRTLLKQLTDLRFATKKIATEWEDRVKANPSDEDAKRQFQKYDNMQNAYKILINSHFGSLGFKFFAFNDYKEADRVTTIGQMLLRKMVGLAEADGGEVIACDTDGVLCIPPPHVYRKDLLDDPTYREEKRIGVDSNGRYYWLSSEEELGVRVEVEDDEMWVKSLTSRMPEGIVVDFDGRAERMMSFKKKNYALKEPGKDNPKIKGGSLISRIVEPYRRAFVAEVVGALLDRDPARIHEIYKRYWLKVVGHQWTPAEFGKTATLKDALSTYDEKIELGPGKGGRNRSAPYELAKRLQEVTGNKVHPGDRISYYVAGDQKRYKTRAFECSKLAQEWDPNNPDEHTEWYLHKLVESAKKFKVFFKPKDWQLLFSDTTDPEVDYSAIQIQNKEIQRKPLKVIIAGTRDVESMFWIERAIAGCKFLREISGDVHPKGYCIGEIVCGEAAGVDALGRKWAEENGIPVASFPADWNNLELPGAVPKTRKNGTQYNATAGHYRNRQMAEYADALVAIWDGRSSGTGNMIRVAQELGLRVFVSKVKPYDQRKPK